MPEEQAVHHTGSGIGKLLQAQTAGLPNWAWLLIIGGGVIAAIFIPKLFPSASTPSSTDTGTTPTDTGTTPQDLSGYYPYTGGVGGGGITDSGTSSPASDTTGATTAGTTTSTPATAAPTQLQTQNAMQQQAQQPPTATQHGTPLSNLQKLQSYLATLGGAASLQQVGKPGTAQSAYVVTSSKASSIAIAALFGAGWTVSKCGSNKYLIKGPQATKVHWGPHCKPEGYD